MEMDNYSTITMEDEPMELPPGFRFHPSDEELITHYLSEKVLDSSFSTIAMGEADLNRIEPWDLPNLAKMGEKEWYFFVVRDRKYPTGLRTNRATQAGYWKATGKDKEIYRGKTLVGMKKTLVFYTGRAPKGEKTNWVMHEYRLDGKSFKHNLSKNTKNDWVISRVFNKTSGAKKPIFAEEARLEDLQPNFLPPLMDSSPYRNNCETTKAVTANTSHVAYFSSLSVADENQLKLTKREEMSNNVHDTIPFSPSCLCSKSSISNMISEPEMPDFQFVDSLFEQDNQSMLKLLLDGKGPNSSKAEMSSSAMSSGISNHDVVNNSFIGPFDHDYLWQY